MGLSRAAVLHCRPCFYPAAAKLVPGTPGTAGSAALTAGGWLRWLVLCLGVTYLFNFVSLGITALLGMLKRRRGAEPTLP